MEDLRSLKKRELRERLYRRRYLIPNAVTVGSMFCGFLSIIYGASGRYEKAAFAIFFAILLDGLDGRVARKLNATSKFGIEFDSFSDLVSFGVAPGLLMYHWAFNKAADEFGVLMTFIFALCAASRLARFNISPENLKGFVGLPSPGAAGVVASVVAFWPAVEQGAVVVTIAAILMVGLGLCMVSNIEYLSVKSAKIAGPRLIAIVFIGATIALVWYNYQIFLLAFTLGYALSGPLGVLHRRKKKGLETNSVNSAAAAQVEQQ